jgi:hypothetical protein
MSKLKRVFKHLLAGRWQVARHFSKSSMARIEAAIKRSETMHRGELRFAVEAGMDWRELLHGITPRQRAIEVFSQLRIWDTEHNSGVLIYLLLADKRVEIIADRGIHARVGDVQWQTICRDMEQHFRTGDFEQGVLAGITAVSDLLHLHFPAHGAHADELPNGPVVL